MRLFIIFPCLLAMAWASPMLKRKLLRNKNKESMFAFDSDCEPCGRTFKGIRGTVAPVVMAPMPNVYAAEAYNPAPQLYEKPAAASSVGQIFNSQEYSSGQMTHFMNANGVRTHKQPAPVLNYANQHYAQVQNAAAASSTVGHSSSTLWEHAENAASGAHKLAVVPGGEVVTFGAVPPVPAANPIWIEGGQYNAYSPLGYTGEVVDNSAAAAATAHSSASSWSQQSGNYGPSNGHGVAFAHASSTSWSSSNSG